MPSEPEFYVGYLPIPHSLKKTICRVLAGLGAVAVTTAAILIAGQHPFATSTFEFQQYRDVSGNLAGRAIPRACDSRPGIAVAARWARKARRGRPASTGWPSGSAQGGAHFSRSGSHDRTAARHAQCRWAGRSGGAAVDLGEVQLTGEIVDSKCYFGVMNPGNGKVHRDCAVRASVAEFRRRFWCVMPTARLRRCYWQLEARTSEPHREPITIRGRLARSSGRLTLYAE
jgi:hypothetical protein